LNQRGDRSQNGPHDRSHDRSHDLLGFGPRVSAHIPTHRSSRLGSRRGGVFGVWKGRAWAAPEIGHASPATRIDTSLGKSETSECRHRRAMAHQRYNATLQGPFRLFLTIVRDILRRRYGSRSISGEIFARLLTRVQPRDMFASELRVPNKILFGSSDHGTRLKRRAVIARCDCHSTRPRREV